MATEVALTPELRQIVSALQKNGSQTIRRMARGFEMRRQNLLPRVWQLKAAGLVRITTPDVVHLTEAGKAVDAWNGRVSPLNGHNHDAGMLRSQFEDAEKRMEQRTRMERRARSVAIRENEERENATNATMPELPADFVESALEQCRVFIRCGNFEALRELSDSLNSRWEAMRVEASGLASRPIGQRLATYLSECRDADGMRIGVRIVNCVEQVCPATLGAIRENWPKGFLNNPNMGIVSIKILGQVLLAAGLIDSDGYEVGLAEFHCGDKTCQQPKRTCHAAV